RDRATIAKPPDQTIALKPAVAKPAEPPPAAPVVLETTPRAPAPAPSKPVYERWWFWTVGGVVVAGAAVGLGVAGTCASIDVYGNGVGEIDQLRITVNGQTKSTPMLRHALPVEIAATSPPALTGNQSVDVVGLLNGNAVGEGAASLVLSVGAHAHAMVTLSPLAALDG